jgi:predicted transcriptional regulator of viral defense system
MAVSAGGPVVDRAIARIAAEQHGVITLAQLIEAGLSRDAVDHRARAGRLYRLHRGVYAVGRPDLKPDGHRLAAVLACGAPAVLSHKSAGAPWEILATAQTSIDVTVPGKTLAPRPGIRVHRTRSLHPEDVRILNCNPVISLARTIVDRSSGTSWRS